MRGLIGGKTKEQRKAARQMHERRRIVLQRLGALARNGHLETLEQIADGLYERLFNETANGGRKAG